MTVSIWAGRVLAAFCVVGVVASTAAAQQAPAKPAAEEEFVPQVGQAGKDVVWVPTPPELVEAMLELAKVTAQDFVMDLGSGDGRNIIAAAKRGARAIGVEFNPKMVVLSRRNAQTAGVGERATFIEGDMNQADISKASVMALFLLPSNMLVLRPKFLDLRPGSRIVSNTFGIEGGRRTRPAPSRATAARGARRFSGSCRQRWAANGALATESWRSSRSTRC
jgi:precorrin-6B methylase 2